MRAAIVLAAGASRRFGRANKLLMPIAGRPVLAHAVARAAARRVIVVTGADAGRTARIARAGGAEVVRARDHAAGLSASLGRGLARLRPIDRELLVYLGDMPFVPDARRWRLAGADAVRPDRGHPVLLRTAAVRALPLSGDAGLAPLLKRLRVRTIAAGPGARLDLDTRVAWMRMRRIAGRYRAFGGRCG
ncbi:MAG: NTP transferase domain-containing protein [Sphingomonas fennica]